MGQQHREHTADEWVSFPGGELEGKRPKAMCRECRAALKAAAARGEHPARRTLCFQCYRADLARDQALKAAGTLNTGSETRLQGQLPFEPVNRPRLDMLKAARATARAGVPQYVNRRREAQIAARHALQQLAAGLKARGLAAGDRQRAIFEAVHAAELQLPDAWLPFVVGR